MFDFTDHTIQQALLHHLDLEEAATRVLLQRADRLVLQIQKSTTSYALKAAATAETIRQEVANNQTLASAGLPVAAVVATGELPVPFVLQKWISGTALDASCSHTVIRETAQLLRRIHQIGGQPPYAGNDAWDQWMKGWLHTNRCKALYKQNISAKFLALLFLIRPTSKCRFSKYRACYFSSPA